MKLDKPRIPAIAVADFNEDQQAVIGKQKIRGEVLNIFKTMANHTGLAKRWLVFAGHVLSKSTLSPRDRELAILRIGWLCQAEYEWAQHVLIGLDSDISKDEIQAIKAGPEASNWNEFDAAILRAADELHADAFISDSTWAILSSRYSTEQLMDLVFAIGQYNLVSMALNSFGVQLDDGLKGF